MRRARGTTEPVQELQEQRGVANGMTSWVTISHASIPEVLPLLFTGR
jgi:hypothetical protein